MAKWLYKQEIHIREKLALIVYEDYVLKKGTQMNKNKYEIFNQVLSFGRQSLFKCLWQAIKIWSDRQSHSELYKFSAVSNRSHRSMIKNVFKRAVCAGFSEGHLSSNILDWRYGFKQCTLPASRKFII